MFVGFVLQAASGSGYGWLSATALVLIAAFGIFVTWRFTGGGVSARRLVTVAAVIAAAAIALVLLDTWDATNIWGIGFLLSVWMLLMVGLHKTLRDAKKKRDS